MSQVLIWFLKDLIYWAWIIRLWAITIFIYYHWPLKHLIKRTSILCCSPILRAMIIQNTLVLSWNIRGSRCWLIYLVWRALFSVPFNIRFIKSLLLRMISVINIIKIRRISNSSIYHNLTICSITCYVISKTKWLKISRTSL
jgi:hypothetical protein